MIRIHMGRIFQIVIILVLLHFVFEVVVLRPLRRDTEIKIKRYYEALERSSGY